MDEKVLVAQTAVVFGLDGRLKAYRISEDASLGERVKELYFAQPPKLVQAKALGYKCFTVKELTAQGRHFLIGLEGVDTPEQAEKLVGMSVYIGEADLAPLKENEAYLRDLIGKEVYVPTGQKVGVLEGYFQNGTQGIFTLRDEKGDEALVPNVPGTIQAMAKDRVVLDFPLELLEINRSVEKKPRKKG